MKIHKTKFYPLDVDNWQIVDRPYDTERAVAHAYPTGALIGMKGAHLLQHPIYSTKYRLVPAFSLEDVIKAWQAEARSGHGLWQYAARNIAELLQHTPLEQVVVELKRISRDHVMAVSMFYARALGDVQYLLRWEDALRAGVPVRISAS